MSIQIGDKIPAVTLFYMTDAGVTKITTDELLSGKKVALFGLPGAFTPTCSAFHLPGYVQLSDQLFAKGLDRIICLSVNDPFVMAAWGEQQQVVDKVLMISDGNAELTQAMGLELDASDRGLGLRSQRYSMVVNDGMVEQLNIEESGKFEVSDAETLLNSL